MGTGFRYLLVRKFGAKMGVDFAASQDDFAFYIVSVQPGSNKISYKESPLCFGDVSPVKSYCYRKN